ncbi:MAG: cation transporter, partial [Steroidobacteraceae bacterium]
MTANSKSFDSAHPFFDDGAKEEQNDGRNCTKPKDAQILRRHGGNIIGIEFAGDVFASSLVLIGIILAAKPADEEHPYGHGRVETLSAFVLGLILMAAGALVSWNSLS